MYVDIYSKYYHQNMQSMLIYIFQIPLRCLEGVCLLALLFFLNVLFTAITLKSHGDSIFQTTIESGLQCIGKNVCSLFNNFRGHMEI